MYSQRAVTCAVEALPRGIVRFLGPETVTEEEEEEGGEEGSRS
jgi:hypothetical protein